MKLLPTSLLISVFLQIATLTLAILITGCNGSSPNAPEAEEPAKPDTVKTLSIIVDTTNPQAISPYFYGQNYWNWVR